MKTLTKLKIPAVVLLTSGMVATALSVPTHVRAESQPVSQVASLAEKIKEERSAIGKTDYLPDILGRIGYAVMVAEQQQLANIRNYQKPDVSYYYEGDVIESVGKLAKNTDVRTSNIFDLPSTDIPFDSDSVVENPFADIEETTKSDTNTSIKPPIVKDGPKLPTVKDEPKLPTVKDEPKLPTVKDEPKLPTVKDEPKLPTVNDEPVLPPVTDKPVLPHVTDTPVLPHVTDTPVLPPVMDTPVLPPVTDEPVLPPVINEPVSPPVTDEPVLPPVTNEPVLPPVHDEPVLPPVHDEPVLPPVTDEPVLPPVTDEPVLPPVTNEPVLPPVTNEPVLPPVTDEPVLPPVTDEHVLPPVTNEPVLPPVYDEPGLPPVTDEPVLPPVTNEPVLPPVTDEPALPPVHDEPVLPPVTDEPVLPPMIDDIDTPLSPPIEPPLDWNTPPTPPIGWDDIPEAPKPAIPETPIVKPIASGDSARKKDESDVRFRQVVEDIPQGRTVQYDDTLPAGQSKLIPGTKGQMIKSYKDTYQNGVLSYSSLVETKTTVEPINDILVMGSKVTTSTQIIDLNTGDSIHGAIIKSIRHDARAFMGKSYHDLMTESEDDRFNNAVATIDLSYLVEDVDGEDMWAWAGVGNDVVSEFNGNKLINAEKVNAYFVEYINMDRKAHGIKPIKYDSILAKLSEVRAQEMADYGHIRYQGRAHTRPDGSSWATIMDGLPSDYTSNGFGENMLAYSILSNPYQLVSEQWIAKRLFEQWKASPSHYKAMMNPNYTRTGVSVKLTTRDKAQNDNGTNWMIGSELFS